MSLTATFHVDCSTRAPAAAREWLRATLSESTPAGVRDALCDDALLCASELITNAVEAGCASATLRLALAADQVRLSIIDDADGAPTMSDADPAALRGRGLVLVDALSSRWGVDPAASGKEVWAELALF